MISAHCKTCGKLFRYSRSSNPSRFCSMECRRDERAKFYRKLIATDTCWLWKGKLNEKGYGWFHPRRGGNELAHRTAWRLFFGEVPSGLEVCHNCPEGDLKHCVNPDHLYLGTRQDNMGDAKKKHQMPYGVSHFRSKLNDASVHRIRELFKQGVTRADIARRFDVHWMTIQCVLVGKTWHHVS